LIQLPLEADMNQTQHGSQPTKTPGKSDFRHVADAPSDTDNRNATEGVRAPDAVPPGDTAPHEEAVGRVPLEENQKRPSDPLKPGEEDEYGTRLEKALSKIEPPGREVPDEDMRDPGQMTPGAPPVDNRS